MTEDNIRIGQHVVCLPRVLGKLWLDSEWYGKSGRVKEKATHHALYRIEFDDKDIRDYWAKPHEMERLKE